MIKKRIISACMAGFCAAMFGVLYPEYILLPDTYQYIAEDAKLEESESLEKKEILTELSQMLYAQPEEIEVSSKLMQFFSERIQNGKLNALKD